MLLVHCSLGFREVKGEGDRWGLRLKWKKKNNHLGSPCIPRSELGLPGLAECCWIMT